MTLDFKNEGDVIYLIGESKNDISSSQYLVSQHQVQLSPSPYFNLDEEYNMQRAVLKLIDSNLVQSAHDVSEGGLFISLLESAMPRNLSFNVSTPLDKTIRNDAFLFGEAQGRVVVSVLGAQCSEVEELLSKSNVKFEKLGIVSKDNININNVDFGSVNEYKNLHENALGNILNP
jgi:phosphoribosylformylglycinamidine synthase